MLKCIMVMCCQSCQWCCIKDMLLAVKWSTLCNKSSTTWTSRFVICSWKARAVCFDCDNVQLWSCELPQHFTSDNFCQLSSRLEFGCYWWQVLECSWDELLQKVQSAKDLDHIIAAHQEFLDTINTRALLDTQSTVSLPSSPQLCNSQYSII